MLKNSFKCTLFTYLFLIAYILVFSPSICLKLVGVASILLSECLLENCSNLLPRI